MSSTMLRMMLIIVTLSMLTGCAEGPLWRAGSYTPWVQNQWAEEEKIADTLFSKRRRMTEMTAAVTRAPVEEQQRVATELSKFTANHEILLLRLHAVQMLGQLNCPASISQLQALSTDRNSDIRLATVKAWEGMPADQAVPQLQQMLGSDTDIDVRLAATRSLAKFSGQQAITAISMALNDPDPALQLRAAQSLQQVTGEQLGNDVQAWQRYVQGITENSATTLR